MHDNVISYFVLFDSYEIYPSRAKYFTIKCMILRHKIIRVSSVIKNIHSLGWFPPVIWFEVVIGEINFYLKFYLQILYIFWLCTGKGLKRLKAQLLFQESSISLFLNLLSSSLPKQSQSALSMFYFKDFFQRNLNKFQPNVRKMKGFSSNNLLIQRCLKKLIERRKSWANEYFK